jgi:hypothetical protein
MKSLLRLSTALLLLIFAATMYAQAPVAGGGGGNAGGFISSTIGSPSPQGIKGVPFSADITNVFTRVLADGNRINRETHGKMFRDSEGRTRRENEFDLPNGTKRVNITISDPVQHSMIVLDPEAKTATVRHFFEMELPMSDRPPAASAPPVRAAMGATERQHSFERVSLGTKEIDGFTVTGYRMSTTIESGRIGNEKPITTVHDSWFSQDLKINLMTRRDDPQSGESTMTMSNIHAGEPDPLLFQVPEDYTVKDNP